MLQYIDTINSNWFFPIKDDDESLRGNTRKRAAPRGRSKGPASSSKRGRGADNSSSLVHQMLSNRNDDDEDDDDDVAKRVKKPQARVRNYYIARATLVKVFSFQWRITASFFLSMILV